MPLNANKRQSYISFKTTFSQNNQLGKKIGRLTMYKTVKTTIRWNDSEGNPLGAFFEQNIDLPAWGKRKYLREAIIDFLFYLDCKSSVCSKNDNFSRYVYRSFNINNITQIISKTDGSYLSLKNNDLSKFISENYKKQKGVQK